MRVKARYWLLIFLLVLGVLLSGLAYFGGPHGEKVTVELRRGQTLSSFADSLKARGVIESPTVFLFLVKLTGKQSHVKAGFYEFHKADHEWRASRALVSAPSRSLEARITVPEGKTLAGAAGIVSRDLGVDSARFVAAARDATLIDSLAQQFPYLRGLRTLEGFLFPDTYNFYRGENPRDIVSVMVERHFSFWNDERISAAHDLNMTVAQIVTLASMVELEASDSMERHIIAGIFVNRLAKGMPLAANSTLGYVLGKNPGWLTAKDLELDSPYNTYKHQGLPPTPVCSPGLASLDAVLHPARTDYLFFVGTGEGKHLFAKTYEEHEKNIAKVKPNWTK